MDCGPRWLGVFVLLSSLMVTGEAFGKAPSISGLSPTTGVVSASVTISGSNFGSSQGTSTVTFNGVQATVTSWKTGSIVVTVPTAATTGPVKVTVSGTASNSVTFTVTPVISSLSPTSGAVGTSVTISGSGFGSSQGSNTVTFNAVAASPTGWNATTITAPVPSGATTGPVVVKINGISSSGVTFTVPPVLQSITVSPQNSSLALPLNEQFSAVGFYSDGTNKDITTSVSWSSLNTAAATISTGGLVTSHSTGSTIITAISGTLSGSSTLTVQSPQLVFARIAPANGYVPGGTSQQFTATGTFSDGSIQDVTAQVTWDSSNNAIATIGSGGLVTGVSAGAAVVSASISAATFTTGVTVTPPGPPTITATVSPAPNAAGWNNTNVTVTFTCTPGGAQIVSCPAIQTVTTEGAGQVVSGTVTDNANNTSTATVTLNIDKTSPLLIVNDPANEGTSTTANITADGTLSDALSGLSSLFCNGTAITPSTSYSCSITLTPGLNLIVVQATDVAGNVALVKLHVTLNTSLPAPTSVQVTPIAINLAVGDSQQFTAVDSQGRVRTDATWMISNTSIATITSDTSPWLSAVAAGSATLTATVQGLTAQAQINILSGAIPTGTTTWSASALSGINPSSVFQAIPQPQGGPDLYDLEANGEGGNGILRGFTEDGQQLWQQSASREPLNKSSNLPSNR